MGDPEYGKKYRADHAEELRKYQKEYRAKNAEKLRKAKLEYQRKNAATVNERQREALKADPSRFAETRRRYRKGLRLKALEALGGQCACCGETEVEFLCIDHRAGGGSMHRKALRAEGVSGYKVYQEVRDDPQVRAKYRVLCLNCNFSAHLGKGECVHQRSGTDPTSSR